MDQYLDECLDEELGNDGREEGPTPPKVNKGGEGLMEGNSSKYGHTFRFFIENMFSVLFLLSRNYF